MEYSQETLNNWAEAYLNDSVEDPHSLFAELEGITRYEAKGLCYRILWTSKILKGFLEVH